MTLTDLNRQAANEIVPRLLECCGSTNWANALLRARPFATPEDLEQRASQIWWQLEFSDWLEAFSKHPKIGEKGRVSQWSAQEQSGMNSAEASVASRLADLNQVYFDKFGYIFIVCATGKSAREMLQILEARLLNSPGEELKIAAAEQEKIALIRLRKLLA